MNLGLLKQFAKEQSLDWKILNAILMCESNASGFDKKGQPKQRFEKHIFDEFVRVYNGEKNKNRYLPGLSATWIKGHNLTELRLISTSFGIAQIMGYYYKDLQYESIGDMLEAWKTHEDIQLRDFFLFVITQGDRFHNALLSLDFKKIARIYNGDTKGIYAEKLKNHYDRL